ncbi:hypothetical protein C8034_v001441 [Colletotrichum sidae]|uniref:Uncharacterized protein n=1 Tax=Colletotrichum sidae TaxID=1347389 RepID=A0A4R8TDW7_9PEZI|nr:hypothetical protein C8034_v001441 [Colletotrichum sidae]
MSSGVKQRRAILTPPQLGECKPSAPIPWESMIRRNNAPIGLNERYGTQEAAAAEEEIRMDPERNNIKSTKLTARGLNEDEPTTPMGSLDATSLAYTAHRTTTNETVFSFSPGR